MCILESKEVRHPFHPASPLPSCVTPSILRHSFHPTSPLPSYVTPSILRHPFHSTSPLPSYVTPSILRHPFHPTSPLPSYVTPSILRHPFHPTSPLPSYVTPSIQLTHPHMHTYVYTVHGKMMNLYTVAQHCEVNREAVTSTHHVRTCMHACVAAGLTLETTLMCLPFAPSTSRIWARSAALRMNEA